MSRKKKGRVVVDERATVSEENSVDGLEIKDLDTDDSTTVKENKDAPDEDAEKGVSADKTKSDATSEEKHKEIFGIVALLFLLGTLVVAGIVTKAQPSDNNTTIDVTSPLASVDALKSAPDGGFVAKTGLKGLTSPSRTTAALLNWFTEIPSWEVRENMTFTERVVDSFKSSYIEFLCDDGYVFIDPNYGVMMIIPVTDAIAHANTNPTAETPIWYCDLWSEGMGVEPVLVSADTAVRTVRLTDGLGEFLRAAMLADDSTLVMEENEVLNSYGVSVNTASGIPSVKSYGEANGVNTDNWTLFLSGVGSAAYSGASVFSYTLCLDENTPPIAAVDENGEYVGPSSNMKMFEIYGIYEFKDATLTIPESLKSVRIVDAATAKWECAVTESEWLTLFNTIQSMYDSIRINVVGTEEGTTVSGDSAEVGGAE